MRLVTIILIISALFLSGCGPQPKEAVERKYTDQVLSHQLETLGYQMVQEDGIIHNKKQYARTQDWNLLTCMRSDYKEGYISDEILEQFKWPDKNFDAQVITGKTVCAIRFPEYQHKIVQAEIKAIEEGNHQAESGHEGHSTDEELREIKEDPTIAPVMEAVLYAEEITKE